MSYKETINQRLLDLYGTHPATTRARWRIIFSDDELITRRGEFEDYVEGTDVFLRKVVETRTLPKYPWLDGQWVVERLIPNRFQDLMEGDYMYECAIAFPKGLPLNWNAIHLFVNTVMTGKERPKSPSELESEEKAHWNKAKTEMRDALGNFTVLGTLFGDKSAVVLPGKDWKKNG